MKTYSAELPDGILTPKLKKKRALKRYLTLVLKIKDVSKGLFFTDGYMKLYFDDYKKLMEFLDYEDF